MNRESESNETGRVDDLLHEISLLRAEVERLERENGTLRAQVRALAGL